MHINKDSRVILLPETTKPTEFKVITLPKCNNLSEMKTYLYESTSSNIYELNEIRTSEPGKLKSGDSVKSFIIESTNTGGIIQSPKTIISSKFNLVYLLISILYTQNNTRFITIDDFLDRLTWSSELPENIITLAIEKICDELIQDDTKFYKFNLEKALLFVNEKVVALVDFISNQSNSIIGKIRGELTDITSTDPIPSEIIQELTLQYSIDYICGSYIQDLKFKQDLIDKFEYKFDKVDEYLRDLKEIQKSLAIVESNMNEVTNSTIKNRKKEQEKKKVNNKKQVKKVAVGKGALDGFFKRT